MSGDQEIDFWCFYWKLIKWSFVVSIIFSLPIFAVAGAIAYVTSVFVDVNPWVIVAIGVVVGILGYAAWLKHIGTPVIDWCLRRWEL